MERTVETTKQEGPDETGDTRGHRRELVGKVTSDKMQKTVVVEVTRRVQAKRFNKYVTRRVRYKAHTETGDLHIGDRVVIIEARPMSKDKRWRVIKLVERARTA